MNSYDFGIYQQQVTTTFLAACRTGNSAVVLHQLQNCAEEAERLLAEQSDDRSLIACGPGCSSCCVVNVSTLVPEGVAIVCYLRQLGQEHVEIHSQRLEKLWRQVRGLDDEERLVASCACAFLDERGCCSIYPVRPLLCRSLNSTSVQDCRDALSGQVLGEEPAIVSYQFQQELYHSLFAGVAEGVEQGGLEGRSYQLAGLVRYLLRHPAAEKEWLAGKKLSWQRLY